MFKVLYNPLAGHSDENQLKNSLKALVEDELEFYNVTEIENLQTFIDGFDKSDKVLLVGGDGTLNKFINAVDNIKNSVWYYAAGSGNDFWTDIGKKLGDAPVCIDEYLKDLPVVIIDGKEYKFINGVGYGIDGWCCEVADQLKAKGKKVNYTSIAIKGLLFKFKPANATVTVDGVTKTYKRCWIAPTMNGRCYGGGMYATPAQDRLNEERKVSCCLMYKAGKIKTLMVFPSIFKGEHVKKTKQVEVLSGKQVTVKFDKPVAAQIDGETILGVTEYTVKTK
ncbi:MAG: diacylglycerol kinase family protein [Clostridia bacterium]|nr:diacylglycerol kinase family protein [Clostridia bacterium]